MRAMYKGPAIVSDAILITVAASVESVAAALKGHVRLMDRLHALPSNV